MDIAKRPGAVPRQRFGSLQASTVTQAVNRAGARTRCIARIIVRTPSVRSRTGAGTSPGRPTTGQAPAPAPRQSQPNQRRRCWYLRTTAARRPTTWALLPVTKSKVDDPWPGADGVQHGPRVRDFGVNGVVSDSGPQPSTEPPPSPGGRPGCRVSCARKESPGGLGRYRNGLAPELMNGAGLFKAVM